MFPFTKPLQKGDKNSDVKKLQEKLIELGFNKTFLQDETIHQLIPDGNFGPITEACLESFQAKIYDAISLIQIPQSIIQQYEFEVNGIMNYGTWYVLENYTALSQQYNVYLKANPIEEPVIEDLSSDLTTKEKLINTVIKLALKEIGIVEKGGNNYGNRVEEYQTVGSNGEINGGSAWCQYFMNWLEFNACEELKIDYKGIYNGYTPSIVNWGVKNSIGKKNCKWDDIKVGDWGFIYSSTRKNAKHVFLIISKNENNKTITTIEGNTNPGGGSDGFGVFKRIRPVSQCWAVVSYYELYN